MGVNLSWTLIPGLTAAMSGWKGHSLKICFWSYSSIHIRMIAACSVSIRMRFSSDNVAK